MNFLNYFCFIFCFVFFSQPSKSDIWVKDIKSNFFEFKSHFISLDSTHLSYGDHLLKLRREETKKFQLKDLILKAQERYLSGEIELALEMFKKISSLSHLADWNEEQRRVIVYSFLRRAQNEKDSHKKQALLLSAGHFMISKVTKDYVDYHLFPPPLLEQLEQVQKQITLLSISLKTLFPHHEIILMNGKQISLEEKVIKIPATSYRITALSSSHAPWIKVIPISYLITQSVKTAPLTLGHCKTLKMKDKLIQKNIRIFYNKDCENNKYFKTKNEQKYQKNSLNVLNQDQNKKFNFLKSNLPTWLIVGTTILTTGIILSFTIDEKDNSSSSKIIY